jgi:GntR family transcriptional regulator/MocR family aminotransferase
VALLVRVNGNSGTPLYEQIAGELKEKIDGGDIPEGYRLPASRKLAAQLGVNRSTVYKAYQELWAAGYIESTPGSYSFVRRRRLPAAPGSGAPSVSGINWQRRSSAAASGLQTGWEAEEERRRQLTALLPPDTEPIDFTPLAPDRRYFPAESFRKCLNTVLVNEGPELLAYGDPQGVPALREYIAERLRLHGIRVGPDEILITAGAQNGIELLFKCFAPPGSAVVVESPSYSRAVGLARLLGIELVPVSMTPAGMDLEELEGILSDHSPALVYTIPNFHNPTGITTSQEHREQLLQLCERAGVPLAEDGFEEEMKYYGTSVLPVKSMDRSGAVLYLGTFSKVLFPGLRIGWIAAHPEAVKQLTAVQKYSLLCGSSADQAALALFCRRGFYDAHLRRMHRIYRSRMQAALRALRSHLLSGPLHWSKPLGGYTLWLESADSTFPQEMEFLRRLAQRGVLVSPGGDHYIGSSDGTRFRLSIGEVEEEQIEEGIRRIGEAVREILQ